MGQNSKIEWTHHTFNPWIGCAKVAPGCTHCYAETFSKRTGKAKWGLEGTRVKTSPKYWREPLKWDRAAEAAGERRRVFCASMADVFEDWRGGVMVKLDGGWVMLANAPGLPSAMDEVRADLFTLIDATPNLDWLLLTKRPENIRRMWRSPSCKVFCRAAASDGITCPEESCDADDGVRSISRQNVWLGTSINDQATADDYWYRLQGAGGLPRVFFLSIEPLTGPIDPERAFRNGPLPDWVIVGGESGHHARPVHPEWVRRLRDFFVGAGVPFFFKQWGEWLPCDQTVCLPIPVKPGSLGDDQCCWLANNGDAQPVGKGKLRIGTSNQQLMARLGKKAAGRLLDGREWNEFPRTKAGATA